MRILYTEIAAALEKVATVKKHELILCREPEQIPVDINNLIAAVGELTSTYIEVNEVDFEGEHVHGMLERYEDRSQIWIKRDQLDDYKNLATAKELCHLLVDSAEHFSPRGASTIKDMVKELVMPDSVDGANVASEYIAEVAAIEILYPIEFREGDLAELVDGSETRKTLALRYDVPEYVVSRVLNPTYHKQISKAWKMVSGSN